MGECPRCGCAVALHDGRPSVAASGSVQLWHQSCWATRHARPVEEVTVVLPEPPLLSRRRLANVFDSGVVATVGRTVRSVRRATIAVTGLALFAAAGYGITIERAPAHASLAAIQVEPVEPVVTGGVETAQESLPPVPDLTAQYPIQRMHGTLLDELYPSLDGWIHPIVGADIQLARAVTGMFGAERYGVMRTECGGGHCGMDLSGPIGRPVVAVAAGTVVHIERSELGRDGRSGRYVRIEHPDGVLTSYMHLSSIRRGIEIGTHVDAGDQIGALGASGIQSASPHLHFALEIPIVPGTHGDHTNTHYADPAPFLVRSTITETADRHEKPAF